jgi:hypothetical protein
MDEMNDEFFGRFSAEDAARLRALLAELGNVEVV